MDKFTKWGYFITCTEKILAEDVVQVYIKKVFLRYRVPNKIISDRDTRFMLVFWQVFTAEQGIKIAALTAYYP